MKQHDHAAVYFPPPLVFALPLVAAVLIGRRWPWVIAASDTGMLTMTGGLLVLSGAAIGLAGVRSFRRHQTTILPAGRPTTTVVSSGPYRFTRNPMYLGMALAYVGTSLALNNAWALLALPIIVAAVDFFVIRREERYLSEKFGESFQDYRSRVRRWL